MVLRGLESILYISLPSCSWLLLLRVGLDGPVSWVQQPFFHAFLLASFHAFLFLPSCRIMLWVGEMDLASHPSTRLGSTRATHLLGRGSRVLRTTPVLVRCSWIYGFHFHVVRHARDVHGTLTSVSIHASLSFPPPLHLFIPVDAMVFENLSFLRWIGAPLRRSLSNPDVFPFGFHVERERMGFEPEPGRGEKETSIDLVERDGTIHGWLAKVKENQQAETQRCIGVQHVHDGARGGQNRQTRGEEAQRRRAWRRAG